MQQVLSRNSEKEIRVKLELLGTELESIEKHQERGNKRA